MAYDQQLAERIRPLLSRRKGFAEKKMFGGVGFLLQGNMCVGIWKDSLIVRFNKQLHDETLQEPHVKPFDITGRVMRGWAMIEPGGIKDDEDLEHWVRWSAKYVATLPPK